MTHPSVSQWVNKNYPRPAVDADWLRDCCAWITDEHHLGPTTDFDEFIGHVETQLLQSSLEDSMVPGTGLPQNIGGMNKTTLSGNPILVEIRSITDIAQSAFSLQTTRQMRIDRADLAGLAPEAEEDEGPIPKYPRGMLSLELSDGSVMLRAIEYRHLPGLELGVTPLGFKLFLKNVAIRDGIAFLEPKNIIMKGHHTTDHEVLQDELFVRSLRRRLGQPEPEPVPENPAQRDAPPVVRAPPPVVRAPSPAVRAPPPVVRAPPPAPVPRPRMPSEAPVAGPSGTRHDDDDSGRPSKILKTQSRPPVSQSASTTARSPYFSNAAAASNNPSAALARERILSPARPDPIIDSDEDFEAFVSMPRGRPEVPMEPSSDYDLDMDMDEEFLAQADRLEMEALGSQGHMPAGPASSRSQTTNSTVGSGSGRSGPPNMSSSSSSQARSRAPLPVEVIEIDDDEDDKENVQVPKRRPVHRRTGPAPDDEIISISD